MLKIDGNTVTFSSGRKVYANNGIIGLSPDLRVSEGYDGGFDEDLTLYERVELGKYMVDKWMQFMGQK